MRHVNPKLGATEYAQSRANETNRPYLVATVAGHGDLHYSMLDCKQNRRVIRECNEHILVTFETFLARIDKGGA